MNSCCCKHPLRNQCWSRAAAVAWRRSSTRRRAGALAGERITPIVPQPKLPSVCVLAPTNVVQVARCRDTGEQ